MNAWRSRTRATSSGVLFRTFFKLLLQQSQDLVDVKVYVGNREEHSAGLLTRYERSGSIPANGAEA